MLMIVDVCFHRFKMMGFPKAVLQKWHPVVFVFSSFTKLTTSQIQSSDRFSRKIRPCTKVVFKWWVLNSSAIGCTCIILYLYLLSHHHQPRVTESRQFNHHLNWYLKNGRDEFNWVCWIPSGELTFCHGKIHLIFHGKIHYFYGHFQ